MAAVPSRARWWPLTLLPAAACAISQPRIPLDRYLAGDLAAVRSVAAREAEHGDVENLALVRNVQAQCELSMGMLDEARDHFAEAARIMGTWAVGGGEVTAAIVGSESSKTYKGDPYEQTMNAFYLAFCDLVYGQPDNARAGLKRGILADAEVGDERYQADNALLFWMAGRMSRLMGKATDAAGFYDEARAANAFALQHGARGEPDNAVLADPERGNFVLLLPIGLGPEKYADGSQEELARFRPRPFPAVAARATVDGQPLGRSWTLVDVDYQARTLGGTAMEGIRKGKAVFKTVSTTAGIVLLDRALSRRGREARGEAIAGGVLLLLGLLTSSSADVRFWPTLPSTVQVIVADLAPGEHSLDVDFLDAGGRPLGWLRHTARIRVPPDGEAWYLLPSLPVGASALPQAVPSVPPAGARP